ncbi:MAG: tRNA-uridine aminocarboxypropyltransferase [Myxococcota bacterium]
MGVRIDPNDPRRCHSCLLISRLCVCTDVPTVITSVDFLIIRHWKERYKASNSARLSAAAIRNACIVDYGAPESKWDPNTICVPSPVLLFPDPDAPPLPYKPQTVIVVDGSWPQARKMIHRIPGLAELPRLKISPPTTPRRRLRMPPAPGGVSTMEAIAQAIEVIDGAGSGSALNRFYDEFVRASLTAKGTTLG